MDKRKNSHVKRLLLFPIISLEGNASCLLHHGWILRYSWSADQACPLHWIILNIQTHFGSRVFFHTLYCGVHVSSCIDPETTVAQTVFFNFACRVSSLIFESHSAYRRKHGIPDSDRRPFIVAYGSAMRSRGVERRAAQEAEAAQQKAEEERAAREGLGAFARSLCIVILALILIQVAQNLNIHLQRRVVSRRLVSRSLVSRSLVSRRLATVSLLRKLEDLIPCRSNTCASDCCLTCFQLYTRRSSSHRRMSWSTMATTATLFRRTSFRTPHPGCPRCSAEVSGRYT